MKYSNSTVEVYFSFAMYGRGIRLRLGGGWITSDDSINAL